MLTQEESEVTQNSHQSQIENEVKQKKLLITKNRCLNKQKNPK